MQGASKGRVPLMGRIRAAFLKFGCAPESSERIVITYHCPFPKFLVLRCMSGEELESGSWPFWPWASLWDPVDIQLLSSRGTQRIRKKPLLGENVGSRWGLWTLLVHAGGNTTHLRQSRPREHSTELYPWTEEPCCLASYSDPAYCAQPQSGVENTLTS